MTERVLLLLARPSIRDALQSDELLETLNDISPLSDHYIPTLQYLIRPDNLTTLVRCMLETPLAAAAIRYERCEPSYEPYGVVYRAHWVLCSSGFSSQLISALLALQPSEPGADDASAPHTSLCERLIAYNSRDPMTLEALARFLNAVIDQYSVEALVAFLTPRFDRRLLLRLVGLLHYEPMRDLVLRFCNELPATHAALREGLTLALLQQLAPSDARCGSPPHCRFARMVFTCDLLTDLIHERRQGTLGFALLNDLQHDGPTIDALLDLAERDLATLPTPMANESYALKVLNSLLQQTQCGCVAKAAFSSNGDADAEAAVDDTELSPHVDLPLLWKRVMAPPRLSALLSRLSIPPARRVQPLHLQLIYLLLPMLNAACRVVDAALIAHDTMATLLALVLRFREMHILHCAVARLFIVALEDSPFLFGRELPALRAANDPLRLHVLLQGCLDTVLQAYEPPRARAVPPALIDVAISLDQAVTNASARTPRLFSRSTMERWHAFRAGVLLPTQSQWEESPASVVAAAPSPQRLGALEDQSEGAVLCSASEPGATATPPAKATSPTAVSDDIPTPLSALYNDEDKRLMLKVAPTETPAATPHANAN
ncbi:hypothetical protein P43SY_008012 [Pythium insidiosum]|uniref:Uncharacterized protein n=1 Tax=Pythium insidiosum TaxID=114742 RepID=A0AAD5LRF5_PYTIN|nr:hypothetical protein P43SY_008012 [Pythium insidiosum]